MKQEASQNNSDSSIIVYSDKTVIKVHGLNVRGLNTRELEKVLMERFHSIVRVIGVTGSSIDMDVYGIDPEMIKKDEQGLVQTISTTEGVTPTEVARLAVAERIVDVDFDKIPDMQGKDYCARQRWVKH